MSGWVYPSLHLLGWCGRIFSEKLALYRLQVPSTLCPTKPIPNLCLTSCQVHMTPRKKEKKKKNLPTPPAAMQGTSNNNNWIIQSFFNPTRQGQTPFNWMMVFSSPMPIKKWVEPWYLISAKQKPPGVNSSFTSQRFLRNLAPYVEHNRISMKLFGKSIVGQQFYPLS